MRVYFITAVASKFSKTIPLRLLQWWNLAKGITQVDVVVIDSNHINQAAPKHKLDSAWQTASEDGQSIGFRLQSVAVKKIIR